MSTGKVVGIQQRNWRDYVASFAEDEVWPYLIEVISMSLTCKSCFN